MTSLKPRLALTPTLDDQIIVAALTFYKPEVASALVIMNRVNPEGRACEILRETLTSIDRLIADLE